MADELFRASTSQLSFEKFINTINQPQAKDLVRSINLFMKNLRKRAPDNDLDSRELQEFLSSMETAFARHPLYAGSTREELDSAVEGLEKYLLTKLYDRTFGADPWDRERDAMLGRRLAALQFVTPAHLEVSRELQGALEAGVAEGGALWGAVQELRKMSLYKSPRDKLVQILNCCKVINAFLAARRAGAGADDFTPTLIYVTIKAQPDSLASNLSFIERYRYAPKLAAEASYFFVQMQGAATFLETLTTSSLACDPADLIGHMLAAGAMGEAELTPEQLAEQRRRNAAAAAAAPPRQPPPPPPPPHHQPSPIMVDAMPLEQVYGNPMLVAAPMPYSHAHGGGSGSGGGGYVPPPPPPPPPSHPPPHIQSPSYYAQPGAGYPAVQYGLQGAPYYGSQGQAVYGQPWPGAASGVPPPPPPPPPLPSSAAPAQQPPPPPPPPPTSRPAPQAAPASTSSHLVPLPPKSVSELLEEGIRLVVRAEAAGELRARYRYLYAAPEGLTVRDVAQLLAAYKELVLRHEMLAQAVENNVLKYYSDLESYQAGLAPVPQPPPPPPPPAGPAPRHAAPAAGAGAPPPPPPPPPPAQPPASSSAHSVAPPPQHPASSYTPPESTLPPQRASAAAAAAAPTGPVMVEVADLLGGDVMETPLQPPAPPPPPLSPYEALQQRQQQYQQEQQHYEHYPHPHAQQQHPVREQEPELPGPVISFGGALPDVSHPVPAGPYDSGSTGAPMSYAAPAAPGDVVAHAAAAAPTDLLLLGGSAPSTPSAEQGAAAGGLASAFGAAGYGGQQGQGQEQEEEGEEGEGDLYKKLTPPASVWDRSEVDLLAVSQGQEGAGEREEQEQRLGQQQVGELEAGGGVQQQQQQGEEQQQEGYAGAEDSAGVGVEATLRPGGQLPQGGEGALPHARSGEVQAESVDQQVASAAGGAAGETAEGFASEGQGAIAGAVGSKGDAGADTPAAHGGASGPAHGDGVTAGLEQGAMSAPVELRDVGQPPAVELGLGADESSGADVGCAGVHGAQGPGSAGEEGPAVVASGVTAGEGEGLGEESEEARQARVDALLQQLLGGQGEAGGEEAVGGLEGAGGEASDALP